MSNDEYMRNVRWTTALYIAVSAASVLLAIAGVYYGLKSDIKDGRTETRELFLATNHKLDSVQHDNSINFQQVWEEIKDLKENKSLTIKYHAPAPKNNSLFTERYINGKLTFIPVK